MRECMEISIQEWLKDLRVERGLTLEQLEEHTHLSKSALGSYEAKDFKDISHYALIKLAKFTAWPPIICWDYPKQKITQTPILQTCVWVTICKLLLWKHLWICSSSWMSMSLWRTITISAQLFRFPHTSLMSSFLSMVATGKSIDCPPNKFPSQTLSLSGYWNQGKIKWRFCLLAYIDVFPLWFHLQV